MTDRPADSLATAPGRPSIGPAELEEILEQADELESENAAARLRALEASAEPQRGEAGSE
jgi:hypothetical protein